MFDVAHCRKFLNFGRQAIVFIATSLPMEPTSVNSAILFQRTLSRSAPRTVEATAHSAAFLQWASTTLWTIGA